MCNDKENLPGFSRKNLKSKFKFNKHDKQHAHLLYRAKFI